VLLITSSGRWLAHVAFPNAHYERPKVRADAKMSSCGAVFTVNCFERHGKHWDKCY